MCQSSPQANTAVTSDCSCSCSYLEQRGERRGELGDDEHNLREELVGARLIRVVMEQRVGRVQHAAEHWQLRLRAERHAEAGHEALLGERCRRAIRQLVASQQNLSTSRRSRLGHLAGKSSRPITLTASLSCTSEKQGHSAFCSTCGATRQTTANRRMRSRRAAECSQ